MIHAWATTLNARFGIQNMSQLPETILIVEDDDGVRSMAALVLKAEGYGVVESAGADQALKALNDDHAIGLVFSDIQMPGCMDGIGLINHLHLANASLPALLTSAMRPDQYPDYPDNTPFLCKPYDRKMLLSAISNRFLTSHPVT